MSKNVAMFVDVANLYYSARGQDVDVDYVALLKHATKGRDLIRAYAYSGLDPENENQRKFIDFLGKNGYRVLTKDIRKFGDGRVKANLDIELVVDLFRLRDRMDIAVIVSGDGDFAPAIRALQEEGVRCEVISFKPNTSSDLIAVADEFIDIMKIAGIGRKKDADKGMPMPEMPAKEVVPEFAFRDASPSVAAAALAALKGGSGRGDGRSRPARRAPAASAEAPAGEAPAAVATDGSADADEPRRRRRRRGGRGRGRGRRDGEGVAAGTAPPDEPDAIGWQELDDLSELDRLDEEREYTFEDADEATLRELGIPAAPTIPDDGREAVETDGDAAAAMEAAPRSRARSRRTSTGADAPADEVSPRPRRRSTARRSAAPSAVAPEGAAAESDEAAPKKPASSRRRTSPRSRGARESAESGAPVEGGGAAAEAAPTAASRGRGRRSGREAVDADRAPTGSDAPAGEASKDEAPQGIWGRFRSGRS